ncbi:spermine oxidase-like [Phymastichus coffea]|uniref:spermine oxidase-like n=1 Tax=Phymastichus coffea TaxID=108790 RepID=UPI00273BDA6A|nr:spermine oxidase-like [Phymastichus coffea]
MRNCNFINTFIFVYWLIFNNYCAAKDKKSTNKNIIIIGAGAAGISAVTKLFEHGFTNLTVLEAENRIGGRLYTTKFGNYSVDLGGQWIHGQKNNTAFELAYPLGLLDTRNVTEFNEMLLDLSGSVFSDTVSENIMIFISNYLLQEIPNKHSTSAKNYGEFIKETFEREFKNVSEIIKHKTALLHYLEMLVLSGDSGDSWYDVAIRDPDGYIDCDGDQKVNWKMQGYGFIIDVLLKRYPDPKKEIPILKNIVLNSEVTSIDYSGNGQPISITTKNGQVYKADHVILTVSLGVLKEKYKTLFNPNLPDNKVSAIEGLGFGSAGKVYLLFESPFWQLKGEKSMHYGFIWDEEEIKAREQDLEKKWTLGVLGASTVEHKPNLLEFYIASRYSKVMEEISDEKMFSQSVELLERFMGRTHKVTKPLAIMRTQWYTNPHFKGTYSYRDIESDKRKVYPKTLEEPIYSDELKILFAGEATSLHRYSTADGAIESGWTAANRLIKFYEIMPSKQ